VWGSERARTTGGRPDRDVSIRQANRPQYALEVALAREQVHKTSGSYAMTGVK
jgi:hypothetical protein